MKPENFEGAIWEIAAKFKMDSPMKIPFHEEEQPLNTLTTRFFFDDDNEMRSLLSRMLSDERTISLWIFNRKYPSHLL